MGIGKKRLYPSYTLCVLGAINFVEVVLSNI